MIFLRKKFLIFWYHPRTKCLPYSTFFSVKCSSSFLFSLMKSDCRFNLFWSAMFNFFLSKTITGAPICHLDMFDKLWKRVCRTVLPVSVEPLNHCQNVDDFKGISMDDFPKNAAWWGGMSNYPLPVGNKNLGEKFAWGEGTRVKMSRLDFLDLQIIFQ